MKTELTSFLMENKRKLIMVGIFAVLAVMTLFSGFLTVVSLRSRSKFVFSEYCNLGEGASDYRLGRNVIPSHYDIHKEVDMEGHSFEGHVNITFTVTERNTNCFKLNSEELRYIDLKVFDGEKQYGSVKLESQNAKLKQDTLAFSKELKKGKTYRLSIDYSGKIRKDLRGFYSSSYEDSDGKVHPVVSTQFEATDFRAAVPSFDEPSFKATFNMNFTIPGEKYKGFKVLSNSKEISDNYDSQAKVRTVVFEKTPIMSTYLVCYIIGEFDFVSASDNGIDFRVFTPVNEKDQGKFALDVAQNITKTLGDYFNFPYNKLSNKMDLIAIPSFRAGAMENIGLITFRASRLLVDPSTITQSEKEDVSQVIAHEISHMWTGNIVTTKWWDSLFLNEGIGASFFEHLAVAKAYPDFDPWTNFFTTTFLPFLPADSMPSSHPLVYPVNSSTEIDSVFDAITYDKGASLMRMFYQFMDEKDFQESMRRYIDENQFSNVESSDLAKAFGGPWEDRFMHWTSVAGIPLVTVKSDVNGIVTLEQKRFWSHEPIEGDTENQKWWIPINVLCSKDQSMIFFEMSDYKESFEIGNCDWYKLNYKQFGLFRVNYPMNKWTQIGKVIKEKLTFDSENLQGLTVEDRLGLVDDVFSLARGGHLPISVALEFTEAFSKEPEFVVWEAILRHLYYIQRQIGKDVAYDNFNRYCTRLLHEVSAWISWDKVSGESAFHTKLRALIKSAMVQFEDEETIKKATELWTDNQENNVEIDSDLRSTVYHAVAAFGGEKGFNQLIHYYRSLKGNEEVEKLRVVYGLTNAQRPSLLKSVLDMTLSEEVREQDGPYVIRRVAYNIFGTTLAWEFVRERFQRCMWTFGERLVSTRLIPGVTGLFDNHVRYDEVEQFLQGRIPKLNLANALEVIRENMHFKQYNYADLEKWLIENGPIGK